MAIEAIQQYPYNLGNVGFGSLTGVQKRPQQQIEQQGQQQYINPNSKPQQVSQPQGFFEGVDKLESYKAQGIDANEVQAMLQEAADENELQGINQIFANKQTLDDGELSPKHDGFAIYC